MKNNFNTFVKNEVLKDVVKNPYVDFFIYVYIQEHFFIKDEKVEIKLLHWEEMSNLLEKKLSSFNLNFELISKKNTNSDESKKHKLLINKSDFNLLKEKLFFDYKKIISKKPYLLIQSLFLTKGYINDPNSKYYHFEIRTKNKSYALKAIEILAEQNIFLKYLLKNNYHYIYVKKSSQISDLLKYIRTSESIISYEDVRIERDFISSFKKVEVIDKYNYKKIKKASLEQKKYINKLIKNKLIFELDWKIQLLAELRLKYLDISLIELTEIFNDTYNLNYSKSAIYHWLRQIKKLGEKGDD